MRTVRIVSRISCYLTSVLAIGYFASFTHLLVAISFKTAALHVVNDGARFEVFYPFTTKPFLLGYYNSGYITMMLLIIGLYAVFFYLLSNVFSIFSQKKLFTQKGITHLKRFYISNLTVPTLAVILLSFTSTVESPAEGMVALHALLGIFTYFLAAIFRQGVNLQNEQDLII
ncbi:DUF2975 domain-containing protein [Parapedobacter tibetensis]|uniref:DUF2975 domain-containing protein n=1 Tax=Parapedobacter tibetensis TaxID=2972951 RepID=UPI00214D8CA4|nr:DUF2975 domain-containing protein [Parapedobacter tibetensis]